MGKNDTYTLSEVPVPNYDAWEFRTCISAQSKDLLKTLLDNDPEPTTGQSGKTWKAWKSRNDAAAELLVKALDDDQLIHIRGLETEPARMWERRLVLLAQLQTFGPSSTLLHRLILLFHFEFTFPQFVLMLRHLTNSIPTNHLTLKLLQKYSPPFLHLILPSLKF